jgi:hypothetical protein
MEYNQVLIKYKNNQTEGENEMIEMYKRIEEMKNEEIKKKVIYFLIEINFEKKNEKNLKKLLKQLKLKYEKDELLKLYEKKFIFLFYSNEFDNEIEIKNENENEIEYIEIKNNKNEIKNEIKIEIKNEIKNENKNEIKNKEKENYIKINKEMIIKYYYEKKEYEKVLKYYLKENTIKNNNNESIINYKLNNINLSNLILYKELLNNEKNNEKIEIIINKDEINEEIKNKMIFNYILINLKLKNYKIVFESIMNCFDYFKNDFYFYLLIFDFYILFLNENEKLIINNENEKLKINKENCLNFIMISLNLFLNKFNYSILYFNNFKNLEKNLIFLNILLKLSFIHLELSNFHESIYFSNIILNFLDLFYFEKNYFHPLLYFFF